MRGIVHLSDVASRAACGIVHLPVVTSIAMCLSVYALDATSRARDCSIDAADTASGAQHVHVCLPMTVLSGISVCVFVPDSTSMSMCCNFHALMLLPGLCVALLIPRMPLPGLRVV